MRRAVLLERVLRPQLTTANHLKENNKIGKIVYSDR
jgi:hypothetical protein